MFLSNGCFGQVVYMDDGGGWERDVNIIAYRPTVCVERSGELNDYCLMERSEGV